VNNIEYSFDSRGQRVYKGDTVVVIFTTRVISVGGVQIRAQENVFFRRPVLGVVKVFLIRSGRFTNPVIDLIVDIDGRLVHLNMTVGTQVYKLENGLDNAGK
jgi:hypothetical protein